MRSVKALLSCRTCRPLAAGEIHPWTRPCQSQMSLKPEQMGELQSEGRWTLAQVSGTDEEPVDLQLPPLLPGEGTGWGGKASLSSMQEAPQWLNTV